MKPSPASPTPFPQPGEPGSATKASEASSVILDDLLASTSELIAAPTPQDAVRIAVGICHERFARPVAGWVLNGRPGWMSFVAARGFALREDEVRQSVPDFPTWTRLSSAERTALAGRFARIGGADGAAVVDAGDAVLLVAGLPPHAHPFLESFGPIVGHVLTNLKYAAKARQRNERLDTGLAWTAHEVRGPLVAVRLALEGMLAAEGDPSKTGLLRRVTGDLGELAQLVDDSLRWAVGAEPLPRRRTDVAAVVRKAVEASVRSTGEDRVDLLATGPAYASVHAAGLRHAIANVVRNALSFSPSGSRVSVRVFHVEGCVEVAVRDRGPGIPMAEREMVFDPFVRGRVNRGSRGGHGLGLFIARRVIDAHGGSIWAESAPTGASFRIRLPALYGKASRSAS